MFIVLFQIAIRTPISVRIRSALAGRTAVMATTTVVVMLMVVMSMVVKDSI